MSESAEHINLVETLREYITKKFLSGDPGFLLSDSPYSGKNRPFEIGGHIPDVIAKPIYGPYEVIIGEAKSTGDLERKHTFDQLKSYLQFCERHSKAILVVAVPWPYARAAKSLLTLICRKNKFGTMSFEVPDSLRQTI